MTSGERLFIELQLKAAWRNVAALHRKNAALGKENSAKEAVKPLFKEIGILGNQYIRDIIWSGMGACIPAVEKGRMFDALNCIVNRPETKEKFRAALYKNGDLGELKRLSMETRKQVRQLLVSYEAHVK